MKYILSSFLVLFSIHVFSQDFNQLAIGEKTFDFALKTIQGKEIQLSKINSSNAVVLIVLRGWPEYQCPVCSRQVGQFIGEAEKFKKYGVKVLIVYPGPSQNLQKYAKEFSADFNFPDNFYFTLDPDYSMIKKYGLRWDAPKETAYPSTFVIDTGGKIVFSKISETHGGRANVDELVKVLDEL